MTEHRIFHDAASLARPAGEALRAAVRSASREGRCAGLALAGGSTPGAIYRTLSGEYRARIDWRAIEVFFGDERAVPGDHPDSNWRMARESLLDPAGVPSERVHPLPAWESDLDGAAAAYESELLALLPHSPEGFPVLDLVWLGVGEDGHTASLFPGSDALEESRRSVVPTTSPDGQPRMTLTFAALDAARHVQFLVTGRRKARVVEQALAGDPDIPAARVRPRRGRVEWLLDREAAAGTEEVEKE